MSGSFVSRRQALQAVAAVAVAGPTLLTRAQAWGAPGAAPNSRLALGFIGVGTMGRGHLRRFLNQADVQVVAVCDVVRERRDDAQRVVEEHYARQQDKGTFSGCKAYNDFRELLARDDLDAVVIATPDHLHAAPCLAAARAKRHVYCEKPLTHTIAEGAKLVATVRENKVVFQTGSQQRSEFGGKFRQAVELVRNGRLGKIHTVRVGVGGPPIPCDLPTQEIPEGTDWDLWLGPALHRGYNDTLCPRGIHKHFPAWRAYREFGGGAVADMGAHHFDIAQWALGMDGGGPVKIEPPAGNATSGLKLTYANGVEMFHGGKSGCTFEGTEGVLYVDRGTMESTPEAIVRAPLPADAQRVYHATDHARNWLDCIRSGEDPICTVEIGASSANVCHLTNIGYQLRRPLAWDPVRQQFAGDDEANALRDKPRRAGWEL